MDQETVTKKTAKAPKGSRSLMPQLSIRDAAFVAAYTRNGGNATRAYLQTKAGPGIQMNSAQTQASVTLSKPIVREAIMMAMNVNGVNEEAVSKRISDQLSHTDSWTVNEGIKHSRAILGLDAPSESHMTVDKRSVNITVSGDEAKSLLKELISKSK